MSPKGEEASKTVEANKTIEASKTDPILEVRNLVKHFQIGGGLFGGRAATVKAGDGVSFSIHRGETLGLGGEPGGRKDTNGRTILRRGEPTTRQGTFKGRDKPRLSAAK